MGEGDYLALRNQLFEGEAVATCLRKCGPIRSRGAREHGSRGDGVSRTMSAGGPRKGTDEGTRGQGEKGTRRQGDLIRLIRAIRGCKIREIRAIRGPGSRGPGDEN